MDNTDKKERSVTHLEYMGQHYYFGSVASIYDHFTSEQIGISYGGLRNYGLSQDKPYIGTKCTIRKGMLIQKAGRRGRKKE